MSNKFFPFDHIMIGSADFDKKSIIPRSMSFSIKGNDTSVDCVESGHYIFRLGARFSLRLQLFGNHLYLCTPQPQEIRLRQKDKELIRFRGIADVTFDDKMNCSDIALTGTELLKTQE